MEEFFSRQIGIEFARVLHEYKLGFPTVRVECDFYRRLCYGDRIDIEVKPTKLGRTSITWGYKGYRAGGSDEIVAVGSVVTVCVNSETFEKVEVPSWLRDKLGFNSTGS